LAFLLTVTFACHEECHLEKSCIEEVLLEHNMVKYENQELGCNSFLVLYKFNEEQYFLWNNHCADFVSYPFNCDGKKLCETGESFECSWFYETAEYIRIVGISE
jgi:hypothetical protein